MLGRTRVRHCIPRRVHPRNASSTLLNHSRLAKPAGTVTLSPSPDFRTPTPAQSNPHSARQPSHPTSRAFLHWRLSDDGPGARRSVAMGRHPKPFTQPDVPLKSVLTTHLGHQVADCGRKSRANRQPLKRINRGASFMHNSIASSEVSPRPGAAKSQVQQIQASPAMTRCRFASVPLDCV